MRTSRHHAWSTHLGPLTWRNRLLHWRTMPLLLSRRHLLRIMMSRRTLTMYRLNWTTAVSIHMWRRWRVMLLRWMMHCWWTSSMSSLLRWSHWGWIWGLLHLKSPDYSLRLFTYLIIILFTIFYNSNIILSLLYYVSFFQSFSRTRRYK